MISFSKSNLQEYTYLSYLLPIHINSQISKKSNDSFQIQYIIKKIYKPIKKQSANTFSSIFCVAFSFFLLITALYLFLHFTLSSENDKIKMAFFMPLLRCILCMRLFLLSFLLNAFSFYTLIILEFLDLSIYFFQIF